LRMACHYPFFKNNYLGTYVREFPELLFSKFNERMLSDMKLINNFMKSELFLTRYFQNSYSNEFEDSIVLGNFFRYLGNAQFSFELLKNATLKMQFGVVKKYYLLAYFYLRTFYSSKHILIKFWIQSYFIKFKF
jgi:hypothetical protein